MKKVILSLLGLACLVGVSAVFAASGAPGLGAVADTARTNLEGVARLITAAAYVAGMAFVVGAIVKFKAHKDNPTQIPIGTPIALLFVGAALIFIPAVFSSAGGTLFGASAASGKSSLSGVVSF